MTVQKHILIDSASNFLADSFQLNGESEAGFARQDSWEISSRTLRGGRAEGVYVVTLNNGAFSVDVLPTRGMGLWRGEYQGLPIGWNSPVQQPVHPAFVNATERNGLGWLTGFNELLCRCGLSSNGAPGLDVVRDNTGQEIQTALTLHGKIANLPAHYLELNIDDEGEGTISVTGIVDETMLFGPCLRLKSTVSTALGSNSIRIHDVVENLSAQPAELQLLYHTNIGRPLLEEGTQIIAPFNEVSPRDAYRDETIAAFDRYSGPVTGFREEAFFFELKGDEDKQTSVLLRNASGERGLALKYSTSQLPCFTLWKNTQAESDGYVTGLEPATNYPNLKTFERSQGRVPVLEPGESYELSLEISAYDTASGVSDVVSRIEQILAEAKQTVHAKPLPNISPAG